MSELADELQQQSADVDVDEQLADHEQEEEDFDEEEGEELEEEEEEEEEFLNNHDLIGIEGIILEQKKEIEQKKVKFAHPKEQLCSPLSV
jgi:hypothetical protein